jgi:aminoglycoside phosphotransferase (APT) family kinase protein
VAISTQEAASIVTNALGCHATDARPISGMAFNQVFEVRLTTGESVYLKLASNNDLQRESAVLRLLAAAGVPSPSVLASDLTSSTANLPFAIVSEMAGEPLDARSQDMRDVGAVLRRVHDIHVPGFGLLRAEADGLGGSLASWRDAAHEPLRLVGDLADRHLMAATLVGEVEAAFADHDELLQWRGPGRLVHGDLHPRHIFAVGREVTGFIDWADAMSGDPFVDLGRLVQAGASDLDLDHGLSMGRAALETYGDADHVGGDADRLLLLYAAWFIVRALTKGDLSTATTSPWRLGQCAVLAGVLDRLRRT